MEQRINESEWQTSLWKTVSNPTLKVVAALVLVGVSTWIVVSTEVDMPRHNPYPLAFIGGHR